MTNDNKAAIVVDNPNIEELKKIMIEYKPDLFISDNRLRFFVYRLGISFVYGKGTEKPYSSFKEFLNFAKEADGAINQKYTILFIQNKYNIT